MLARVALVLAIFVGLFASPGVGLVTCQAAAPIHCAGCCADQSLPPCCHEAESQPPVQPVTTVDSGAVWKIVAPVVVAIVPPPESIPLPAQRPTVVPAGRGCLPPLERTGILVI